MNAAAASHPAEVPVPIVTPGLGNHPSPVVKRTATVAARSSPGHNAQHPAVWQPWTALEKSADARYKTEINDALRGLETAIAEAGTILDTAAASAAEAAGRLESAAWAAWHKGMAAADDTRTAIMAPALASYEQAIGYAHAAYARLLQAAEATHKTLLSDAQRAQSDAKSVGA